MIKKNLQTAYGHGVLFCASLFVLGPHPGGARGTFLEVEAPLQALQFPSLPKGASARAQHRGETRMINVWGRRETGPGRSPTTWRQNLLTPPAPRQITGLKTPEHVWLKPSTVSSTVPP